MPIKRIFCSLFFSFVSHLERPDESTLFDDDNNDDGINTGRFFVDRHSNVAYASERANARAHVTSIAATQELMMETDRPNDAQGKKVRYFENDVEYLI